MTRKKLGLFEFRSLLENDSIFRDYFNKFCCLPIFGQRITYLAKRRKFSFDPPPSCASKDRVRVAKDNVFEWLHNHRYSLFCNSDVGAEFYLCNDVSKFVFDKNAVTTDQETLEDLNNNTKMIPKLGHIGLRYLDDLKQKYLCKVSQMMKFTSYIESSTACDHSLIGFWLSVEHMENRVVSRATMLREIQRKYIMRGSPHCLPFIILDQVRSVKKNEKTSKIEYGEVVQIKELVFQRIVCYWLIKYLAQCNYMTTEDRFKLRQIAAIDTLDDLGRMVRQALMQSQYVRVIRDPEAPLVLGRDSKWIALYQDHEEEVDNVLVKKETVQDVWAVDEKKEGNRGSQLLGAEDINFIHDKIFGKDLAISFTTLTKQEEDDLREQEQLGKIELPSSQTSPQKDEERATSANLSNESSSPKTESPISQNSRLLYADGYEADNSAPPSGRQTRINSDELLWRPVSRNSQLDAPSQLLSNLERVLAQIQEESTENASNNQQMLSGENNRSPVNLEGGDSNVAESSNAEHSNVAASTSANQQSLIDAAAMVMERPTSGIHLNKPSTSGQVQFDRSKSAIERKSEVGINVSVRKSRSVVVTNKELPPKFESRKKSAKPRIVNKRSKSAVSLTNSERRRDDVIDDEINRNNVSLPKIESSSVSTESGTSSPITSLFLSAPISTNPSQTSVMKQIETEKRDYLKCVEPHLKIWDILSSDILASRPFREYLERQHRDMMDQNGHGDFGGHENFGRLISALDLWGEIESLRTLYVSLSNGELVDKVNGLITTFNEINLSLQSLLEETDFNFKAVSNISNDLEFPDDLIRLQRNLENALEDKWVLFAISEQKHFIGYTVTSEKTTFKRRNSFPSNRDEYRVLPILCNPLIPDLEDGQFDDFQILTKSGNFGTLGPGGEGHMRYRTARAYRLLLRTTGSDLGDDFRYNEFIGDESSDEEGGMPPIPIRVRPILPKLDPKVIAQYSVKEYPRAGIDYSLYNKVVKVPIYKKRDLKPLFLRPIRKNGVVLQRPAERPKALMEVLKEPLHFEFFKRYLKIHKSEAPLLYWKCVELLKRTEEPGKRQKKAQQILKKFFSRLAGGGIMLQCDADIIKEIAMVDTVTTSMLIQAEHEVFKSMEKNWSQRYFSTFRAPPVEEIFVEPDERVGMDAFKNKLANIWRVFSEFMRRSACFIKCMRDMDTFHEFYQYLESLPNRPPSELNAGGDASSTAILFQKNATVMYKHLNTDIQLNHTKKEINGSNVTLDFLPNDLVFWTEAETYVSMMDNLRNMIKFGCYDQQDRLDVREKSEFIVGCFLNSSVPPRTRVNVDKEVADAITKNVFSGIIDRGLFHEAVISVFPNLVHFWKKYRNEKFTYVPKKNIRKQHRETVQARKKQLIRKYRRQLKKKLHMPASQMSTETVEPSTSKNSPEFPDYVNGLSKKKNPYDKVKGLLHSEPPTLHFSLEHGLKLILPPRRKKVEGIKQDTDENLFMNVWTKGAKVVNVIREGSDPKLYNLEDRKKGFKVKCDLVD